MNGPRTDVRGPPYTEAELDAAQARFGFFFPPDLRALLLKHRIAGALDWTRDHEKLADSFAWPYEGLLFDVEENELWRPEWGPRPEDPIERAALLRQVVDAAPRLIPVFGHRYMPETPHEAGNPVFSVYQADIVVYGRDLDSYIDHEFVSGPGGFIPDDEGKSIPFWSELVRRGYLTPP